MARTPKKPTTQVPPSAPAAMARHKVSRHEREVRRQRTIIIVSAVSIGIALVSLVFGVLYDQLWLPSRPVATVGGVTLTRGDYNRERRTEIATNIAQNLLFSSYGAQFSQQFLGQIGTLDAEISQIGTVAVNDSTVNNWLDRQLVAQSAQKQFGIQTTEGEVAQLIVGDFGPVFAPPMSNTVELTPTALPTALPTATMLPTPLPGTPVVTPTSAPTFTPLPTTPPTATPLAAEALTSESAIYTRLVDVYRTQLSQIDQTRKPQLTADDFKGGLRALYRDRAIQLQVESRLVPDAGFVATTDPSSFEIRHILIDVTVPVTATDTDREAAFTTRRADADAVRAKLKAGEDFATVAKAQSADATTRDAGGVLPSFDLSGKTTDGKQMDPALVAAARSLKEGEVSDPVRTSFGWHVIELVRRTVDSRDTQLRAKRDSEYKKWVDQQRVAAAIERVPPQTATPTLAPTAPGEAPPLPTVPLAGEPTTVLTGTLTLPTDAPTTLLTPTPTPAP